MSRTTDAIESARAPFEPEAAPLITRFHAVRRHSEALVTHLSDEDMVVQSMPDASPTKWHLAHTTWFFEFFVLRGQEGYQPYDSSFDYLFNSYYEAVGKRHPRPLRGLLTRPSMAEVRAYRQHVNRHMRTLMSGDLTPQLVALLELGIAHEEQHQELLVMDAQHLLAQSPIRAAFDPNWPEPVPSSPSAFRKISGGLARIGATGDSFAFDNEGPRHGVWLEPYEIADHLVTNGQWMAFMADGGYDRASLWLSDGWAQRQAEGWQAPLYWEHEGPTWYHMTPRGSQPVDPDAAVVHVSYYEADAYARWAGLRLPSEAEWEHAVATEPALRQVADTAWQWTASAYNPYPGFRATTDAVGEYNGKFMSGQMVLRGGAPVTPMSHARITYRNFYRPAQRWMFAGVRVARDPVDMTKNDYDTFRADVVAGLTTTQKHLSPKYFYDEVGSNLFEAICLTPEYYPTRTETALLREISSDLADAIPSGATLLELGSGASEKTQILLDAKPSLSSYVPVDISAAALRDAASRLSVRYPEVAVYPLEGDFTQPLSLPAEVSAKPIVVFFPGSTIGNFETKEAVSLLRSVRELVGPGAHFILGADLVKDRETLLAAYDDAQGVTAAFNRNILTRINRELRGNFDETAFAHEARWNEHHARIEMHLVSRLNQIVTIDGVAISFLAGESIHTESSHKFTPTTLNALAEAAGWEVARSWVSSTPSFGVFLLRTPS